MAVAQKSFGVLADGSDVTLWTISNGAMRFSACDYGCLITSIVVPQKRGAPSDVTLGFSTLDGWTSRNTPYFGAFIGRYANRVAGARFLLDGAAHQLDANNGGHSLHGGFQGYHQMLWKGEPLRGGEGVRFTRRSPDGEQGYPGNLDIEVDYSLTANNEIVLRYRAKTDAPTPVNFTQHIYFNLKGAGSIAGHRAQINSGRVLDVDDSLIPTGKIISAANTAFDFSAPRALGERFGCAELAKMSGGYDCAYCFEDSGECDAAKLPVYAEITEPETGRALVCRSNQPTMQLYTGCTLSLDGGKNGVRYHQFDGFCLETQRYTNAPNIADFPSPVLRPGERYEALTVYGFGW